MNKYFLLFAIFCATLFSGCSSDEPESKLFRLSFSTEYSEEDNTATYKVGSNYINVDLDGFGQSFTVTLDGNFETFAIAEGAPEWASASANGNKIVVDVKSCGGSGPRTGKINFVVFRGSNSETGYIQISQKSLTYEDLLAKDRKAVKKYLSQYKVIETLPADNSFHTGSDAPYYKLNSEGTVYMQVISLGSMPPAKEGDQVYFRFMRYNLLEYYYNGHFSEGWGNANDISVNSASFVVGSKLQSTTQWGFGIPLPIELGLPLGSEVNLVISSDAGFTSEIANVIPYLYHIKYYPAEQSTYPVHLNFSNSMWAVYGVSAPAQWSYFNKSQNLPAGFPYTSTDFTGCGGILLVGNITGDVTAYEAACPVEQSPNVSLTINDNLEAECPICGSKFDVLSNGTPLSGKAVELRYGLRRYNVIHNSNGYTITN